jgi:putative flavoprotein involved in K+ transport
MNSSHSTTQDSTPASGGVATANQLLDVAVIGAGQAGLSMAWYLARRGVRYLVIDSHDRIGESWRNRYDTLRLFSPAQYDSLPGADFPAARDTYPGKDDVADFLSDYAERNAFPVLAGTTVNRLTRVDDSFELLTTGGIIRARQVVVATGACHDPYTPTVANSLQGVTQLHSADYRRPSDLPAGRVLVVGAANSGLQIAAELAGTHQVTVAVGTRPPAVPQRIAGRDLFWWFSRLGLMNLGPRSALAKRLRARGDVVIGTRPRDLAARGVDFRPRLVGASGSAVRFADGTELRPDTVIWATGYRPDYSWIDIPDIIGPAGQPRHDRGRSLAAPGLAFLGLPWQRSRGSSLLGFVQRDAAHLDTQMFDK